MEPAHDGSRDSRRATWQFGLIGLASVGTVQYAMMSARNEEGFNIFIAYWHAMAVITFFFVLPIIVAIGYLGGHAWARTAHLVKAGGCAYGALSIVLPTMYSGIFVYWPLILIVVVTVLIDAVSLSNTGPNRTNPNKPEPPSG